MGEQAKWSSGMFYDTSMTEEDFMKQIATGPTIEPAAEETEVPMNAAKDSASVAGSLDATLANDAAATNATETTNSATQAQKNAAANANEASQSTAHPHKNATPYTQARPFNPDDTSTWESDVAHGRPASQSSTESKLALSEETLKAFEEKKALQQQQVDPKDTASFPAARGTIPEGEAEWDAAHHILHAVHQPADERYRNTEHDTTKITQQNVAAEAMDTLGLMLGIKHNGVEKKIMTRTRMAEKAKFLHEVVGDDDFDAAHPVHASYHHPYAPCATRCFVVHSHICFLMSGFSSQLFFYRTMLEMLFELIIKLFEMMK